MTIFTKESAVYDNVILMCGIYAIYADCNIEKHRFVIDSWCYEA